jgi:propionyl-CoA carboxylase alpha chain
VFSKVLIANRGEIAVRVIRACREMGISTVAVYSDLDRDALHVRLADEAYALGGQTAAESYIDAGKILDVIRRSGAEAVHPGYGFFSENTDFAKSITDMGVKFIGPLPEAIDVMGDKISARHAAESVGVSGVPGDNTFLSSAEQVIAFGTEHGFPVAIKAAYGGGGRGMKVVNSAEEAADALESAQREAKAYFGRDECYLERYLTRPRHVEVQLIADQHGNCVYLGTRDCSAQRRHQKLIEEAPAPGIDPAILTAMGEAAVKVAKGCNYENAGTVEFLYEDGDFFYLEMNTRLQVEHPVTEMVTGLDLVELQLRIAAGEPLPFTQEKVRRRGWAMEARICAEDPGRGFLPATGLITRYAQPRGKHIRVDSGIGAGTFISAFYDSLLAKVITWGDTREEAIQTLVRALNIYHLEGITTNIDFVNAILNHPAYQEGALSTRFIERHFPGGQADVPPPTEQLHYMVMAATLVYHNRQNVVRDSLKSLVPQVGVTHAPKAFHDYTVRIDEAAFQIRLEGDPSNRRWNIRVDDRTYEVITPEFEYYRRRLKLKIDGQYHYFRLQYSGNDFWAAFCGLTRILEIYSPREWALARFMPPPKKDGMANILLCPMPGLVVDIRVKPGDPVFRGQDLVSIESMKMESYVASPCDGVVAEVKVESGQAVETGDTLVTFKL